MEGSCPPAASMRSWWTASSMRISCARMSLRRRRRRSKTSESFPPCSAGTRRRPGTKAALSGFLEEVSLFTDIDNYDQEADSAVMMTIHSAKGAGVSGGLPARLGRRRLPRHVGALQPEEVEEERRLAYVAITRAREELYIYHAESRMIFGTTSRNRLSRFGGEIPEELLEHSRSREWAYRSRVGAARPGTGAPRQASPGKAAFVPHPVKPAPAGSYKPGDTVSHKTFGQGLILSATPMANDTLLEIAFEKVGTKKLFANFARLTKL